MPDVARKRAKKPAVGLGPLTIDGHYIDVSQAYGHYVGTANHRLTLGHALFMGDGLASASYVTGYAEG